MVEWMDRWIIRWMDWLTLFYFVGSLVSDLDICLKHSPLPIAQAEIQMCSEGPSPEQNIHIKNVPFIYVSHIHDHLWCTIMYSLISWLIHYYNIT